MPALLTHFVFGVQMANEVHSDLFKTSEELNAFLLGNQGSDPFLARHLTWPNHALACNRLHQCLHTNQIAEIFSAFQEATTYLPEVDTSIGQAFTLGILSHHALNKVVRPFIDAQQDALIHIDPSLEPSRQEILSIIETDLDSWLLWNQMHTTVEEFYPAAALEADKSTCRVGGALFSQVALAMFGLNIGASEYAGAIADYARIYRTIEKTDPTYATKLPDVLYRTEMFVRPSASSYIAAMSHQILRTDAVAAANLKRIPWKDPATNAIRTESFPDLLEEASHLYQTLVHAYTRNDRTGVED